jgi:hypothetical protein
MAATIVWTSIGFASTRQSREQKVHGEVVAYSTNVLAPCVNGNVYWSMILRTSDPSRPFARVDFSLACAADVEWLSGKQAPTLFRLLRDKSCDEPLDEFIQITDTGNDQKSKIPRWTRTPIGQKDALPFGKIVPCFRSKDLPTVPVF